MKLAAALISAGLGLSAIAAAADQPPTMPDSEYCSRRDADPQKCVIEDGPPNPNIIRKKPSPPPPPPPRKKTDSKSPKKE